MPADSEPTTDPKIQGARLSEVGFSQPETSERALQRVLAALGEPAPALLAHLASGLQTVADPDRAVVNLERFALGNRQTEALFEQLRQRPRSLEILVTLFAGSRFLSEILLRAPEYFDELLDLGRLVHAKDASTLLAEVDGALAISRGASAELAWDALRRLQRRELLRIGACDLLGLTDLPTVARQLSLLAETMVRAGLRLAHDHGKESPPLDRFCVLALGKLGGGELNYSSDIDLVFVSSDEPASYWKLAQTLVDGLARSSPEGFLYRIDLRLRPWGRDGPLVSSSPSYVEYLERSARRSEVQALLKARPIAGTAEVGQSVLDRVRPLLLASGPVELREQVRALKERIEADLRRRGRDQGHVKSGRGSIRDIEFATQYLQLVHGADRPRVLEPNTLNALALLLEYGCLTTTDYRVLVEGYVFLRTVEHHLQLMHNSPVRELPTGRVELRSLARRLRFFGGDEAERFQNRYEQHSAAIRDVYETLLASADEKAPSSSASEWTPAVSGMPETYARSFTAEELAYHARLAQRLDGTNLVEVDARPLDEGTFRVSIVGYEFLGGLSVICGLLLVYGFNIVDGSVFTSHVAARPPMNRDRRLRRRRARSITRRRRVDPPVDERETIVDIFTVRHGRPQDLADDLWNRFRDDLSSLLSGLAGDEREATRAELAKRIALSVPAPSGPRRGLHPIDIEIDNDADPVHTVLRIEAPDTVGFLYELTNSLALGRVSVKRMTVRTREHRVADTLFVCDASGKKITEERQLEQLRVATVLTKHFTHLLPGSPNPASALQHFREYLGDLFRRPDWSRELASLEQPEVLDHLARLLGVSDFLWQDFLRMQHSNLFPILGDVEGLEHPRDRETMEEELAAMLCRAPASGDREALNSFKDREMFRIDMRQILGLSESFEVFSSELTMLGELVFAKALALAGRGLEARFGRPPRASRFALCGLGKFGGRELGFASDLEVLFVYTGSGGTEGGGREISLPELYERWAEGTCAYIAARQEGIFEIDLRLRPYGSAGPLAVSLDAFREYFSSVGEAWGYERQALLKLRPIAGDRDLGEEVLRCRDELLYTGETPDLAAHRAMRERQLRHLVTPGTINAKYSAGGLVDVEYVVQLLQLRHGASAPELRTPNTLEALAALHQLGRLPAAEHQALDAGYRFFRRLIDALRMVRGHAKDLTVPAEGSEELDFLARRFGDRDTAALGGDLDRHLRQVRELAEAHFSG